MEESGTPLREAYIFGTTCGDDGERVRRANAVDAMVFGWFGSRRSTDSPVGSQASSGTYEGNEYSTKRVLERFGDDTPTWGYADAPLFVACRDGDIDTLRRLLAQGVDVGATDSNERTPLHIAASKGYATIAALLLAAGADASAVDTSGNTALHQAADNGHGEAIKALAKSLTCDLEYAGRNGWTALHWASSRGKYWAVQALVALGVNLDAATSDGQTALHLACTSYRLPSARILVEAGANVHAKNKQGHTTLASFVNSYYSYPGMFDKLVDFTRVLVSFGARWDSTCDGIATASKLAALGVCVVTWEQEHAQGRRFTDVPFETLESGPAATRTYIRELQKSTDVISRRKICMVGPSKAGKTSLVKSLTTLAPCLEHPEDRTIGIDHFHLRFPAARSDAQGHINEVTFWDFAGQNEYQVAHSLFYSRRALYLVCVDLEAYIMAHMQADLMTNTPKQRERLMNEFVESAILRWVRCIFALQPEAEFVFVATKEDLLCDPKQFSAIVRKDLIQSLQYVQGIVAQMKLEHAKGASLNPYSTASRTIYGYQTTVGTVPSLGDLSLAFVSCENDESVQRAREQVEGLIVSSNRSFDMPDSYSRVLEAIVSMRGAAAKRQMGTRVDLTFLQIDRCVDSFDYLQIDRETCYEILRVLHDLGDVLWYEELGLAYFQKNIVLDPMLLIDFVRQVISHTVGVETMAHDELKGLPFWVNITDDDRMLALKQMLQKFHLVHPTAGPMTWDSDLIVPAYWRSNTPASWLYGGEKVLLGPPKKHYDEAIRVHWEYHFAVEFPTSVFDHLLVASYSPFLDRRVGPDWILYQQEGVYSCRIMVDRDLATKQRTLRLEAALAVGTSEEEEEMLWQGFEILSTALVRVLRRYPGLLVSSFAIDSNDHRRQPKRLESLFKFPLSANARKWMPREATWGLYKHTVLTIKS